MGLARAQNSGTIPATPPLGRGTLCSEQTLWIHDPWIVIYDLKAQEKRVTAKYANHAKEETDWEFPSHIWRISRLHLLAAAKTNPIWPGLGSAGSVTVKDAKQSQFAATLGGTGPGRHGAWVLYKQTQLTAAAGWAGAPGAGDEGQMRQTNPIFLRAKRTASALRGRIYGE